MRDDRKAMSAGQPSRHATYKRSATAQELHARPTVTLLPVHCVAMGMAYAIPLNCAQAAAAFARVTLHSGPIPTPVLYPAQASAALRDFGVPMLAKKRLEKTRA